MWYDVENKPQKILNTYTNTHHFRKTQVLLIIITYHTTTHTEDEKAELCKRSQVLERLGEPSTLLRSAKHDIQDRQSYYWENSVIEY